MVDDRRRPPEHNRLLTPHTDSPTLPSPTAPAGMRFCSPAGTLCPSTKLSALTRLEKCQSGVEFFSSSGPASTLGRQLLTRHACVSGSDSRADVARRVFVALCDWQRDIKRRAARGSSYFSG